MKKQIMSQQNLKRAYQLVSVGNKGELVDTARNGLVVFRGTYAQCVRAARKLGVWYS